MISCFEGVQGDWGASGRWGSQPCPVQFSHSVVSDSANPWIAALQASLSITNSQSLLKLMSIPSVMPSNHLILCHPLQFSPASGSFPMSQFFASGGQSIGVSASASILPMSIWVWFPFRLSEPFPSACLFWSICTCHCLQTSSYPGRLVSSLSR